MRIRTVRRPNGQLVQVGLLDPSDPKDAALNAALDAVLAARAENDDLDGKRPAS